MNSRISIIAFGFALLLIGSCASRPEDAYFEDAIQYRNEGEFEKAIENLKKTIAIAPRTEKGKEALYILGDVYYQTGDVKKALKIFNKYLEIANVNDKKRFMLLNKIALINYSKLGEYKEALPYYFKAASYASSKIDKFDVYTNMGNCYFKLYKFDKAVEFFNKGISELGNNIDNDLVPRAQEALYYMAFSYSILTQDFAEHYQQKGFNPAEKVDANEPLKKILEILDRCISYSGQSKYGVLCRYQKAETLEEIGDKKRALAILSELRDIYPNKAVIEGKISKLLGENSN